MAEKMEKPESADKEVFYEMLWDCAQCNTKGLLGTSQRHCPVCGAAQDPKKRYFPKEGEEVEAKNHRFVGVDWHCGYCQTPNSAAAAFCTNCGAGKDGTKPVALVEEKPVTPPPEPPKKKTWLWWVLGIVVAGLAILVMLFSSKHDVAASVAARDWQREIQVERLMPVSESAWCDAVPNDAYGITRSREVRSTNKVPDGQDCHTVRHDKGDGSFVKSKECTPRYREEPVYDQRCHFQVKRWRVSRTLKAGNAINNAANNATNNATNHLVPAWPTVNLAPDSASGLGHGLNGGGAGERLGAKSEHYELTFKHQNKTWNCSVPEAVWNKYQNGSNVTIKVRAVGGVDCSAL